jgi:flagellar biosynthesis component FlhA
MLKLLKFIPSSPRIALYSITIAFCIGCSQSQDDSDEKKAAEQSAAEKTASNKKDGLFSAQQEALNQAKLMKEKVEAEQKKQAEALKKIKDDQ